ncbi:MAG TPA: cupredoxin domain-containing protein [Gemmatimonadaceae bacterium]|nr:cupredoxin domain-containing protein [Gemmatimonadaceae bacterium]
MKRMFGVAAVALLSSAAGAQATNVKVTLTEWKVKMSADTVPAGRVSFTINNYGSMNHALHIKGADKFDKETREIAKNEVGQLTVTLKPGTYEVYCPLAADSHHMAGMKATLVVTGSAAKPAPKKKP